MYSHTTSRVQDLVDTVHFLPSFSLTTTIIQHHKVERPLVCVCVEGRGRISRSVLTQDIKMSTSVFQFNVPHQWIAQRHVGHVAVYCDGVGCHALCLRHDIPSCVGAHWSKYRCYTQTPQMLNVKQKKKKKNKHVYI